MAELVFFSGTMDCGKSTLALQTDHNHASRGRAGLVFTQMDRAGAAVLSSRLGLRTEAIEVDAMLDLRGVVVDHLSAGGRLDYLICDEAQFYTPQQVEQLADVVDEFGIDNIYKKIVKILWILFIFNGSQHSLDVAAKA